MFFFSNKQDLITTAMSVKTTSKMMEEPISANETAITTSALPAMPKLSQAKSSQR